MKHFFEIFKSLVRYRMFTGLTIVSFSISLVISYLLLLQIHYEFTYNRDVKDSDRVFALTTNLFSSDGRFTGYIAPGFAHLVCNDNPFVENYYFGPISWADLFGFDKESEPDKYFGYGPYTREAVDIFGFQLLSGSWESVFEHDNIAVSRSTAEKYSLQLGDYVYCNLAGDNLVSRTIGAIYNDQPVNSDWSDNFGFIVKRGDSDRAMYESNRWDTMVAGLYVKLHDADDLDNFLDILVQRLERIDKKELDIQNITRENITDYIHLTPLDEAHFNTVDDFSGLSSRDPMPFYMMLAVPVVIMLIAFVNFFNMFFALATRRVRSVNTQKVMGAYTGSLRLQLLAEVVAIVVGSLLLSWWIVLFIDYLMESPLNDYGTISVIANSEVSLFLSLTLLLVSLALAVYPVWLVTSFPPTFALKGIFISTKKGKTIRNILIGVQFLISFVFIAFTLIIYSQYRYMMNFNLGYDKENLYTFHITYNLYNPVTWQQMPELRRAFMEYPAVQDVTFTGFNFFNLENLHGGLFFQNDGAADSDGERVKFRPFYVDYNFFSLLDIKILQGRGFSGEFGNDQGLIGVCNETMMRKCNLKIGDIVRLEGAGVLLVGVCEDFYYSSPAAEIEPLLIIQNTPTGIIHSSLIRTAPDCDFQSFNEHLKKTLAAVSPAFDGDGEARSATDTISWWYDYEYFMAVLMLVASVISVFVTLLGVFGIVVFETQARNREIAIRRVNGATVRDILKQFNGRFMRILIVCYIVSLPLLLFSMEWWMQQFSNKMPFPLWIFVVTFILVALLTFAIVTLSAWRVVNRNPTEVLGKE